MLAVIDANIVFSALIKKGKPFEVFELNRMVGLFEFLAPEFLFFEIDKRKDKLAKATHFSESEIEEVMESIKSDIAIISFDKFSDKFEEALKLNKKDSPYLALALKLKCPIISGDKELKEKQSKVRVISPAEALSMLCNLG